jgi:hypothetical protein
VFRESGQASDILEREIDDEYREKLDETELWTVDLVRLKEKEGMRGTLELRYLWPRR